MKSEEKMSKKIIISCEEAGLLTTMNELGDLTFYQKIQLAFHNVMCKVCKVWAKQSAQLTKLIKTAFDCEKHKMCDKRKSQIEKDIDQLTA